MDVELIKIDPLLARRKLEAYRKAINKRIYTQAGKQAAEEWEKVAQGYKAAQRGLPLIELSKAMARGGWDAEGRPKFAVCRADQREVRASVGSEMTFVVNGWERKFARFAFRLDQMPARTGFSWWSGTAIVPMVPPDVLPRVDLDLSRRVILWEADWKAAPVDPLLLLPIGGDLYAVEAAWDLTPLERAVIQERRR